MKPLLIILLQNKKIFKIFNYDTIHKNRCNYCNYVIHLTYLIYLNKLTANLIKYSS